MRMAIIYEKLFRVIGDSWAPPQKNSRRKYSATGLLNLQWKTQGWLQQGAKTEKRMAIMFLLLLKLAHPVAVIIMTLLEYWNDR